MRRSSAFHRRAGFTLFEILIGMTILALAATVAITALKPPSDSLTLQNMARGLSSTLRLARARALARNEVFEMQIDLARKSYRLASEAEIFLPARADIVVKAADLGRDQRKGQVFSIRFYPDGSSSGAEIGLRLGAARARIDVNWLTGIAKMDS